MPHLPRIHRLLPLLIAVTGLAAPAASAPLPFQGSLSIVFGPFPIFAVIEGSGVAQVNGDGNGNHLTSLQLPAGVFVADDLSFPGTTAAIQGVQVSGQNGPGAFTGLTPLGGGGVMPLSGAATLCLLAPCGESGVFLLTLPLTPLGNGGTAKVTGPVTLTLHGQPWTKGTVTISTPGAVTVLNGFAHGPASLTTSTAQPGGVLELVTPIRVTTTITGIEEINGYAVLEVQFVPEPGTASLLGVSLAALAWGARTRRIVRKRS